eukprot:Colp12_sorted_trinity150504_noHs@12456
MTDAYVASKPSYSQLPSKGKRKAINKKTKLEIKFDEDARKEFVTGFHKRKQERRKVAQEQAEKKAREELLAKRKEKREAMKAIQKAAEVNINEDDLMSEEEEEAKQPEEDVVKYVDEDVVTTVTTVSDIDISRNSFLKPKSFIKDDEEADKSTPETSERTPVVKATPPAKGPLNKVKSGGVTKKKHKASTKKGGSFSKGSKGSKGGQFGKGGKGGKGHSKFEGKGGKGGSKKGSKKGGRKN